MPSEATYGFNETDARELVGMIGKRETILQSTSRRSGFKLFAARLKEPWSSKAANCDIYSLDGATLTDTGFDDTVYDPLEIFSVLTTNDFVLVGRQAGKYYALIAPCPT